MISPHFHKIKEEVQKHPEILREITGSLDDSVFWVVTMPGYCWGELKLHSIRVRNVLELRTALPSIRGCNCFYCLPRGRVEWVTASTLLTVAGAKSPSPPPARKVYTELRDLLTMLLFWMEDEIHQKELDPKYPAWFETMLWHLKDEINYRISNHAWRRSGYANESVLLGLPGEPGLEDPQI